MWTRNKACPGRLYPFFCQLSNGNGKNCFVHGENSEAVEREADDVLSYLNGFAAERAKVKELADLLDVAIGWTGVATVTPEDGRAVDRIDRAAFLAIKDARASLAKAGV